MIRKLALALIGLAACAALPGAARAHWEMMWDDPPPRLSPAQAARVDLLAGRAVAAFRALPADHPAYGLATALNNVGQCRRAEEVLGPARPAADYPLFEVVQPALTFPDRACALRLVAWLADAGRGADGARNPANLYQAGALWRRLGEEARGQAAIAEAERLFDAQGAAPCYDSCTDAAWRARLGALRIYHGTALYAPALRRLAERALAARAEAERPVTRAEREEGGYRPRIDGAVFDTLIRTAFEEGAEDVARLVAARRPQYAAWELARARMTYLFDQHRFAEALPLGREVTRFDWWNLVGAVQTAPEAFHAERAHMRDWTDRSPELLTELARTFMKRGDRVRAREVLRTLRAQVPYDPSQASSNYLPYAAGMEAMIDAPADPLAALARRQWPHAPFDRGDAYGELARHLARAGRWAEFDRAMAIAGRGNSVLAGLPCIVSRSGAANVRAGLRRAQSELRRPPRDEGAAVDARIRLETVFSCLLEAGHVEAAIEVAGWHADRRHRLSMLVSASQGTSGGARVRRRLANLVLAAVESGRDPGDKDLLGQLAQSYEQLGDYRTVERILRRARSPADRFTVLLEVLQRYDPYSPMLDRIYGFARGA